MSRARSVSCTENISTEIHLQTDERRDYPRIKFDPVKAGLPLALESQCLFCERVCSAIMKNGDGVLLEKECPNHGPQVEKLHDAIFTESISAWPESPSSTFSGHPHQSGCKIPAQNC